MHKNNYFTSWETKSRYKYQFLYTTFLVIILIHTGASPTCKISPSFLLLKNLMVVSCRFLLQHPCVGMVVFTSIYFTSRPKVAIIDDRNLVEVNLSRRGKISLKSIPSTWAYPFSTRWYLYLYTLPYAFNFFLNTHFLPIGFLLVDIPTRSQAYLYPKHPLIQPWPSSKFTILWIH